MKKFLAVFVAPVEAYDKMKEDMQNQTPEDREKMMQEWQAWMERHKDKITDPGGAAGAAKRVTKGGVTDVRNEIGGYMLIQAESAEEAAAIFEDSPHFGVEGGAIDVMELVEM